MKTNLPTILLILILSAPIRAIAEAPLFDLEVLPCEHRKQTDPETGAELTFLTTHPAGDVNLYYEQRSWLADSSAILFTSSRENGGLMAYLTATGELVRLKHPQGGYGYATCAKSRNSFYAIRGNQVVEVDLEISPSSNPSASPSRVRARERVICALEGDYARPNAYLTENSEGACLGLGVGGRGSSNPGEEAVVISIGIRDGSIDEIARLPGAQYAGHVMFSLTNPNLLSYKSLASWTTIKDVRTKETVYDHKFVEGEFCTHHCWWIDDTLTFCGGFHPQPTEDADVKVLDFKNRVVRILGKGNWWPEASSEELARFNWWHAAGHENGRWVVADNWHGDIGLIHAKSTRTYILTQGHREYGRVEVTHPHVGWDRKGEQVVFASGLLGNDDVCIATIPPIWQAEWESQAP
ncbi:MAG: hypothetical protein HUU16_06915 [Candidatus Omnitrophica bacterium]|nr:hypothetical protein [bacterium]NUN95887.1 hypothetical protein [Candidatus Omnitrophota bacterium]